MSLTDSPSPYEPDDGDIVTLSVVEGAKEKILIIRVKRNPGDPYFNFTVDGQSTVYKATNFLHLLAIFTYVEYDSFAIPSITIIPEVVLIVSVDQRINSEELQEWTEGAFEAIKNKSIKLMIDDTFEFVDSTINRSRSKHNV